MSGKPKILVADDAPDNVALVQDLLIAEGYDVIPAYNGEEALLKIRLNLPDVVLLDINMPRLDGYKVCEQLKADPATADIPVLMLTAWAEPDQRVKGLQLGAEDYLAKPFDYRELVARVRARLRTKQTADELRAAQQAIRYTFERYVSPRVVERLLADPSRVRLGGVQQQVTILFADLRGYTALAEALPPEQLVDVLNGHLTVAAQAILAQEGTISTFVGDLVMAIYNAPLPQPDHALRAARAALALHRDMTRHHVGLPPELRMHFGVGIVTGDAVVGNLGARELQLYTAVGDVVNLAQRLEEIAGGGRIFISDGTRQALGPQASVRSLGSVLVRGRTEPVVVYELQGLAG
ncbi:MAG: response regulator [Anaerolineae bacterium]|nr:response regulator [Anaerolineae bacterium]